MRGKSVFAGWEMRARNGSECRVNFIMGNEEIVKESLSFTSQISHDGGD